MIHLQAVVAQVGNVGIEEVADWIARGWVMPAGQPPDWLFAETDIVRLRLVRSLRHEVGIEEPDLALILSLVDQVRDLREALNRLLHAAQSLPPDAQAQLLARLGR